MHASTPRRRRERGIVLVSSLLLLIVITLIAVSMFRSFGLQERIAGNLREKHRAVQAAESAQQYAEWWLTSGANANNSVVCAAGVLNANANQGQVCSNTLQSLGVNVTTVPWSSGGPLGVDYTPPGMAVGAAAANTYFAPPRFYIAQLGAYAGGNGTVYQIDSIGYGGTSEAVAVIESTYLVSSGVQDLGAQ
jgi:type IV pilus assembly protein PilX